MLQRESFGLGPVGAPVVIGDHARHLGTLGEHRVDDLAEIEFARNRDDARERLTERTLAVFGRAREHGIERLPAELCLSLLVEHREMRRDLSLEREALQQPLAEAVDSVDLEPAFGFERPGKEAPRLVQLAALWRTRHQPLKLGAKLVVGDGRPGSEVLEQAILHLGRRRLGVGEAEDRFRLEVGEQEPLHALDQHRGLARAGIGRYPGGRRRIGGARLIAVGFFGEGFARAHLKSSSSSCVSHSWMRASWA